MVRSSAVRRREGGGGLRRAAGEPVSAALLLLGCGQIIGADEYEAAPTDGPSAYATVASIFGGGACADCISENCDEEVQRCAEDDGCVADARCIAEATDPPSFFDCGPRAEPLLSCILHGTHEVRRGWVTECEEECSLGRRLDCADRYEFEPVDAPDLLQEYRFAIFNEPEVKPEDLAGLPVWVCDIKKATCGDDEPSIFTGPNGVFTVENLSWEDHVRGLHPLPFALQIGEPGYDLSARFLFVVPFPRRAQRELTLPAPPKSVGRRGDKAGLYGRTLDCLPHTLWGTRSAVIEAEPFVVNYGVGVGAAGMLIMGGDSTDVQGTFFSISEVDEGLIDFEMRDAGGSVLNSGSALLKAGYWNSLVVGPSPAK